MVVSRIKLAMEDTIKVRGFCGALKVKLSALLTLDNYLPLQLATYEFMHSPTDNE